MIRICAAIATGLITASVACTAHAQSQISQCFVQVPGEARTGVFYWSGVVTHPAGEYEQRLFNETFAQSFERYVRDQVRHTVNVSCQSHGSFYGAEADRSRWMYNYPTPSYSHIMTDWTDGRPLATGEVSVPPAPRRGRLAGPPAIVLSSPESRDNRRTPGEIAREDAQRLADRQRAQEQAERTAALQQEARRLRDRAASEAAAADARDRANRCGRYRDPNSRSACVSPQ